MLSKSWVLAPVFQMYVYGNTPPFKEISIEPSVPPLQLGSITVVLASNVLGSEIIVERESKQPLASVIKSL